MSLQLKKRFKDSLNSIPVYIEDTSLTSAGYFNITEFPSFFGRGKNSIRIKPNRFALKPESQLYIEILDINENSVYYEIPEYSLGDLSRYISVWVYGERDDINNTPNGIGEVIICGIVNRTSDGNDIPNEFRDVINVRWKRKIPITRDIRSVAPIVFSNQNLPTLSISESLGFYSIGSTNITPFSESINNQITYTSDASGQNVFLETPNSFVENFWVGGKIKINLQNTTVSPQLSSAEISAGHLIPPSYTASIQSQVSSRKLKVLLPLTSSISDKTAQRAGVVAKKVFTSFSTGSFIVEYFDPSDTPSSIPVSFAHLTIKNISPIIGNIDRINVYAKSKDINASNTQYRLIGSKQLNEPITSSLTDIYHNNTNFTQSYYTFPFPALKENDLTDIKVEFVNPNNDTSEYELVTQHNFVGYNPGGGGGGSIEYVSGSTPYKTIEKIKVEDNDNDVYVSYNSNIKQLTLQFGTPTPMGQPNITYNPNFNTDRFNRENQTYTVSGNFPNNVLNSYEYIISASLMETLNNSSSIIASTTTLSARSLTANRTTSGSVTYSLRVTASRDSALFTAEYTQSRIQTDTNTVSKTYPVGPQLNSPITYTIQNGYRNGTTIEQHATGSISFGYITGSDNRWQYIDNSLTASVSNLNTTLVEYKNGIYNTSLNLPWTGLMTGSDNITIKASANYQSPIGLNNPQLSYIAQSSPTIITKVKSIRYGIWAGSNSTTPAALTGSQPNIITNLGLWYGLSVNGRQIVFNTLRYPTETELSFGGTNGGNYIFVCGDGISISQVRDAANNTVDTFNQTPGQTNPDNYVSYMGYKIYLSRTWQTSNSTPLKITTIG